MEMEKKSIYMMTWDEARTSQIALVSLLVALAMWRFYNGLALERPATINVSFIQ